VVDEGDLLDFEVNEDGGLRLFCGRASDRLRGVEYVLDSLIIGLTKRLVLVAEVVATTTNWFGSWEFGVAVTGLRSRTSWYLTQHSLDYLAPPFSEDRYQETLRAIYERLVKDPDGIVADLIGRLNRGLGGSAPIPQ
jgi:hypothetical protein